MTRYNEKPFIFIQCLVHSNRMNDISNTEIASVISKLTIL